MSYLETLLPSHPRGRHRAQRRRGTAALAADAIVLAVYVRMVSAAYPVLLRAMAANTPGRRLVRIIVPPTVYDRLGRGDITVGLYQLLARITIPRTLYHLVNDLLARSAAPSALYNLLVSAPGVAALGGFVPYVLLSVFAPGLMNASVAGGLDVGAVLGLMQLAGFLAYAAWAPHSAPLDAPALEARREQREP